jgi:hypothetical protein
VGVAFHRVCHHRGGHHRAGLYRPRWVRFLNGGALLEFENLLFAIRNDLGYKNKGLKQGDLLKVFVNNAQVDEYIKRQSVGSGQ